LDRLLQQRRIVAPWRHAVDAERVPRHPLQALGVGEIGVVNGGNGQRQAPLSEVLLQLSRQGALPRTDRTVQTDDGSLSCGALLLAKHQKLILKGHEPSLKASRTTA
jgi:hypothetical protein